jgi:hypothetical protein
MEIKEKLLKDYFMRSAPMSMDVTTVKIDHRQDGHDILHVFIRGQPAGQLVTDKTDSVTIARRLIPDSLRYDKEPSSITHDAEQLAAAYFALLLEARAAVSTGSLATIASHLKELDANHTLMPGDSHVLLPDRMARLQAEGQERLESPPSLPSD